MPLLLLPCRREAQKDADSEPMLSSFLYASVLAHDSFARSLAFVLANRLANTTLLSTQLFEVFLEVLTGDENVRTGALADIIACRERVSRRTTAPACSRHPLVRLLVSTTQALLAK